MEPKDLSSAFSLLYDRLREIFPDEPEKFFWFDKKIAILCEAAAQGWPSLIIRHPDGSWDFRVERPNI